MDLPVNRRQMLTLSGLSLLSACSKPRAVAPQAKPNFMIVLADSLRWDHVGCYGQFAVPTPNIDRLAREGIVFERCYSSSSWTRPAIGTLFAGVLPRVHQAVGVKWSEGLVKTATAQTLRPCFTTLAESLRNTGYQTAYFVANGIVSDEFGFARGFDHYRMDLNQSVAGQFPHVGTWLNYKAEGPFFLMVHAMNPHFPYTARTAHFKQAFDESPKTAVRDLAHGDRAFFRTYLSNNGTMPEEQGGHQADMRGLSPAGRDLMRRLYAAEVVELDHALGGLLESLERSGHMDNTYVLFVSDHGEAFGEHDCYYHTNRLFEHQTRIPLVVRPPHAAGGGRHVASPAGLIDIYPTLAHLAGAACPDYLQGIPLPLLEEEPGHREPRLVFADHQLGAERTAWDAAVVAGTLKAMVFGDSAPPRVHDLQNDPEEQVNLLASTSPPSAAEELLERLHSACETHDQLAASFGDAEWVSPSSETTQAIEAMGYL